MRSRNYALYTTKPLKTGKLIVNSDVAAKKSALRTRLLAARAAHGAPATSAATVSSRLAALPELVGRGTVLGYAATAGELSIDDALRRLMASGVTVCLPWVDGDRLGVGSVADLDRDVEPGWRNVREPRAAGRTWVRPRALDAVIVPGVGFDLECNRLGYGGGHFDRLLAQLRRDAVVIGVALDEQVVGRVPVAPHDRPVDVLVTPTRTRRCDRA